MNLHPGQHVLLDLPWDDPEPYTSEEIFMNLLELMMGISLTTCRQHGLIQVTEFCHNSGFAGEGFWYETYSCGCSHGDHGNIDI